MASCQERKTLTISKAVDFLCKGVYDPFKNAFNLSLHLPRLRSRGSPNGTIGNFTNDIIGSRWYPWHYHWYEWFYTNGTIGRNLNDIGIPLVPSVEP